MEYIFGTVRKNGVFYDNLKTVGNKHTDLNGAISIIRKFPDNIITDNAKILEHYHSTTDDDGKCYDWYTISDHYRIEDKFTPQIGNTEIEITNLEIENIEQGISLTDAEIDIIELKAKLADLL